MKSAIYNCRDRDNKQSFYLVVYDETMPCALCGLPVLSASVSATAICGWCDCGKPRAGTESFREDRRQEFLKTGKRLSPAEAWSNKRQDFFFDTREEADCKMYELHQEGVEGFPHVVERMNLVCTSRDEVER